LASGSLRVELAFVVVATLVVIPWAGIEEWSNLFATSCKDEYSKLAI